MQILEISKLLQILQILDFQIFQNLHKDISDILGNRDYKNVIEFLSFLGIIKHLEILYFGESILEILDS